MALTATSALMMTMMSVRHLLPEAVTTATTETVGDSLISFCERPLHILIVAFS